MFSPTRTALCLAIGAILAASEANAGCKIISGTKVCAAWITGSEICKVTFDNAPPNDQFATVTCSITGFGSSGGQVCLTGTPPPGTLACGEPPPAPALTLALSSASTPSKKGESDEGNRKHNGDVCEEDPEEGDEGGGACFSGVPDIIPPQPVFTSGPVPAKCDKKGNCKATAEVLPLPGSICAANGGPVIDFTADEFLGRTDTSDGGEGGNRTLYQRCTLNGNGNRYDCVELDYTPLPCGGT